MTELSRTLAAYEADAESYVEKYQSMSVARHYGEPFLETVEDGRVLDVGCGPGPDLAAFADAGFEVVGVDIAPTFLRAASEHVPEATLVRGDMRRLPFRTGSFDGVWSSASFLHVPRTDAVGTLREFRRVLRPDGHCFLSAKREPLPGDEETDRHFEYYDRDELVATLTEAGLEPVDVRVTGDWVAAIAASESEE